MTVPVRTRMQIGTEGAAFVDAQGRQVLLRGVNLGGDCKLPYPHGGTQYPSDFADHREVSFVGRPFPLHEADEHFERLRHWGFNCLRWLTTWEAVEHTGPGCYDTAYLNYLEEAVARAGRYGFHVFLDFHQDAWSRMSGGSGAPGWTFEAAGLQFSRFDAADAAHTMQRRYDYTSEQHYQPSRYPVMSWPGNYRRPANAIMWTAFFAGARFTPRWEVEGENIQHYLQRHYLGAVDVVAQRMAAMPHVIGFDTLNEPGAGWIGLGLTQRPPTGQSWPSHAGLLWSALDGLRVARGQTVAVPTLQRDPTSGLLGPGPDRVMNAAGAAIWRPDVIDPFEAHGAWRAEGGQGLALREDFFSHVDGRPVDLSQDVMAPFFDAVARTVRAHRPNWLLFAELNPYAMASGARFPANMPAHWVNASHWYDLALLGSKRSSGRTRAELADAYRPELAWVAGQAEGVVGGGALGNAAAPAVALAPTLLGEFGIPFDLDNGAAYGPEAAARPAAERWAAHVEPLAAAYDVMDELLLSGTLWNYSASNSNHPRVGDGWNQEDLSIFSRDQQAEAGAKARSPDAGGRATAGFVRPWVQATQGRLLHCRVQPAGAEDSDAAAASLCSLDFRFDADPRLSAPTVVFLPKHLFPAIRVSADDGLRWQHDTEQQCLALWATHAGATRVRVEGIAAATSRA